MSKISRDRVVAASVFHIIRAYLVVYRGTESFKGITFAISDHYFGWYRLYFYLSKYIEQAGGVIIQGTDVDADVCLPLAPNLMIGSYNIVIPLVSGASARNLNKDAVILPYMFSSMYDVLFGIIDHNDVPQKTALQMVSVSVYDAAYYYFYDLRETYIILEKE